MSSLRKNIYKTMRRKTTRTDKILMKNVFSVFPRAVSRRQYPKIQLRKPSNQLRTAS